jgi:intron-binding protein aquarius
MLMPLSLLPLSLSSRALQKFSHLDQSLFTRFIRLGMPYIQLNAQGRMRSSLAALWSYAYNNLGDLPAVQQNPAYLYGNVGFAHEYQLVNVEDLNGVGESSPTPYFYQNLAEAEYIVQTYMYMRLLGYPASRISILTTYNGQKSLIRDILDQRCAKNLLFGLPAKVSTVDKFQGQQNDFILLSLVRTRTAGHLRDLRRLVVAMSRARLGMYIFGRVSLFTNCFELTRTFNQLLHKPTHLQILPQEKRPMDVPMSTSRLLASPPDASQALEVRDVLHMGELVSAMTLSVQGEYSEYSRRIQVAQEEARQAELKRQALRQAEAEREEARRLEAQRDRQLEQEIEAERANETDAAAGDHLRASRRSAVEEAESSASEDEQ